MINIIFQDIKQPLLKALAGQWGLSLSQTQQILAMNQKLKEQIWTLSGVRERNTQLKSWRVPQNWPPEAWFCLLSRGLRSWTEGLQGLWGYSVLWQGELLRCDWNSPCLVGVPPRAQSGGQQGTFQTELLRLVIKKGWRNHRPEFWVCEGW